MLRSSRDTSEHRVRQRNNSMAVTSSRASKRLGLVASFLILASLSCARGEGEYEISKIELGQQRSIQILASETVYQAFYCQVSVDSKIVVPLFLIYSGHDSPAVIFHIGGCYQQKDREENPKFSRFPIADFDTPEPLEPTARAARETRGRKYNHKHLAQIAEDTYQIFSNTDWDVGLPALPVERSVAIVIGKVTSSKAYLSPDKTGIYSEFEVAIDSVVKNDPKNMIRGDATITVERNGGRARMPSGRIVVSWVSHQNMPRVGGRYVLFLTHDFETPNDMGKDFYILTGYELQDGQVRLLDDTQPGHPITSYNGRTESTLLNDLFNTVAKTSNPSN